MLSEHRVPVKTRHLRAIRTQLFDLQEQVNYWKLRALMAESVLRGGTDLVDVTAARKTLRDKRQQTPATARIPRSYGDGLLGGDTGPVVRRTGPRPVGRVQVLPQTPASGGSDKKADSASTAVAKPRIRKRTKRSGNSWYSRR